MLSIPQTTEYKKAGRQELDQLLSAIALGDKEALGELYRSAKSAVYAMALSYLKNAQDAQDLTQDVFVRVWDKAPLYTPGGSPMGWLLTICRNLCLMQLRSTQKQTELAPEEWDAIPAEDRGLNAEESDALQHALAGLGEEERRIVLLHSISGLKHREIAAILELPLATVLSKYHRALRKMRAYLEGDDAR